MVNFFWLLACTQTLLFLAAPYLSQWVVGSGWLAISLGMPLAVVGYGLRDVIHEAYGKSRASQAVLLAFATRAIVWSTLFMAGFGQESFRLLLAGELQLVVSQLWVDSAIYERLRGRSFARRYNLSNLVGVTLSLIIFVLAGFWGTGKPVAGLIVGGLALRLALAAAMTMPMARLARAVAAAFVLFASTHASALDLGPARLHGSLRFWMAESGQGRLENSVTLSVPKLRVSLNDWFTHDPGPTARTHHKVTLSVEVAPGTFIMGQTDTVTGRETVRRVGVEWRW